MALKVITPPAAEPVTLEEVKTDLRMDQTMTDFDNTLNDLIIAAREEAENYLNRAIFTQTLELSWDNWPDRTRKEGHYYCNIQHPFELLKPPIQSVTSVSYTDKDGNIASMDLSNFIIDLDGSRMALRSDINWPLVTLQSINAFRVRYIAGYDDITKVPKQIKQAIRLYVAHRFNNPDDNNIPDAFYNLLSAERVMPV